MPIYVYRCLVCEGEEEVIEKVDAPLVHHCPECGNAAMRVPSTCAFSIPGFKNGQAITEDSLG